MKRLATLAAGLLRFVGALLVGLVLLLGMQTVFTFAQVSLLGTSAVAPLGWLSALWYPLGSLIVLAMAARYAATGRLTKADRVMVTAAAGLSAAVLVAVIPLASLVVFGVVVASFLMAMAGGGDFVTAVLAPAGSWAMLAINVAVLCLVALGFAVHRLWKRPPASAPIASSPPGV